MKMNRYIGRGIVLTLAGIGIGLLGNYLQETDHGVYRWVLIAAVIVFGIGFLTILYGLIRKIERKSILEERSEQRVEDEDNEET